MENAISMVELNNSREIIKMKKIDVYHCELINLNSQKN